MAVGRRRRSKKASSRRTSRCPAPATPTSTAATSSAGRRAATARMDLRHAIEQSCDVYFYTVGNMIGVDKIHKWATRSAWASRAASTCRTKCRGWCRPPSGSARRINEKWYAGRDHLGGDRPGAGVGDADLAGGLHGDARQRRHARDAAPAQSGRRWHGLEADAAAGAAVGRRRSTPTSCRRSATACGWWSTARAPAAGRGSPGTTSPARPAARRSSRTRAVPRRERRKDLRDHGWFVFFAPRDNPQIAGVVFVEHGMHAERRQGPAHIAGVVFVEHGIHGGNAARIAITCSRRFSPSRTAGRCRLRRPICSSTCRIPWRDGRETDWIVER